MTGRLAQAFVAATEWLLRVRIAMHTAAGRRQDHLRFPLQEAIAPLLCPDAQDRGGVIRPAVHPAVEALMHQYHAHAKLVRNETERLLQRATAKDDSRRPSQPVPTLEGGPIDASFVIREGALEAKDGSVFETKPSEMLRIFQVAIAHDLTLSLRTREILAELAVSHAEALRKDPESGPCFVEILCDQRDRANPSRLEQMQDLGLAGGDDARVGAVDRPRPARHLSRVHRRPARALRDRAAARAGPRRPRGSVPAADRDGAVRAPAGGAGGRHAAARRRQALRQPAQRDRRRPGRRHLPAAGDRRGRHPAGRVPGPPAPGDGADVAAPRSGRHQHDLRLRDVVRRRGEPARAVPADLLRSVVGGARRDVQLERDAAGRAVLAHAGLLPPRPRPAGRRARRDRVAAAEARGGDSGRAGGPRPRWRRCSAASPIATSPTTRRCASPTTSG